MNLSTKAPVPLEPVSAEDFARRKRRILFTWLGLALLVILVAAWIYQRSTASAEADSEVVHGEQLLKAARYADAIQEFDRALAVNNRLSKAYLLRARANLLLLRTEPAIQDFTKVIQLLPNETDAFMERAAIHLTGNDFAPVIADCTEVIRLNPKLAHAYTMRGIAFRETGSPQKAVDDFNRALELSPGLGNYFQRATTYQAMGQHALAITDLNQLILLSPASPIGYLARSRSREALGDLAGARRDREESRRLEILQSGR